MRRLLFISKFHLIHLLVFLLSITAVNAKLTLPKLVSDGMVLQRNTEVTLWGYADAGALIKISFLNKEKSVKTNSGGIWQVEFKTPDSNNPETITIASSNEVLSIKNVVLGDVYLCSGQSNMELPMSRVRPLYEQEITTANYPDIRYFEVPKEYNFSEPQSDFSGGKWVSVNENTIESISAVAYFFAKEIHIDEKVPVGIINASLGGSPIESWLDLNALNNFPEALSEAKRYQSKEFRDSIARSDQNRMQNWYSRINNQDVGLKNNWKSGNFDSSNWDTMTIPGYWSTTNLGAKNGVVWFSKSIKLSSDKTGKPADLEMGRIVDADSVFINGTFIGNTTYQYPPRRYHIPEGILKEDNKIVVRIINEQGRGGFVTDKQYELKFADTIIDLKGSWHYKLGTELEALQSQTFIRWKPTGLYNAMINPLIKFKLSGILWYQGESNVSNAEEYDDLIKILVKDWRSKWNQGDTPFMVVQLANFLQSYNKPTESSWAVMRESQAAVLDLKNTALAVLIDVGEWNDIHPLNKKDVGHRLALGAKKIVYKEDIIFKGPTFESMKIKGNSILVNFKTFGSQLKIKGSKPEGFAIAGQDGQFYWADAKLTGDNCIVLTNKEVSNPKYVRYAWADNPDTANIFNSEGLPALPFRTDKTPN